MNNQTKELEQIQLINIDFKDLGIPNANMWVSSTNMTLKMRSMKKSLLIFFLGDFSNKR